VKDEFFLKLLLIGLAFIVLAGVSKHVNNIPYSQPHIEAAAYVWENNCKKDQYLEGVISCDCENDACKLSSWKMRKYGINPQRSEGLYGIGNDLVELSDDYSGKCSAKNTYRNSFYQNDA
jgi:hypothetical protein